ncbi:glycosyltransferase family 4 protein [Singulisphaera sp. Ch08]|uniref:Glycosyltransferase family 4 protein n=1 Tax=Singulisphaera sp. Ch08 TaxID=3120278 RepID=A0AAU7CI20_9BACT
MKLALITRRYPPFIGGAEKVLSYLAPALAAEGADVTVLTAHAPGLAEHEEIDVPAGRLTVIRLATSRARFIGTWLYMRNLRRWLSEHAIDAAYVSMLKHDAYVAVERGKRLGFPVVLRPEGAGATGDLAWQSWGRFGQAIGRRCREADAIVSISQAITTELLGAGFDGKRIQSLPNGVPVPTTPWQPRPDWRSAPRAHFVGRLAPEKGLDTLVDAWPLVLATHPRAKLTLIGEGPERAALERQVERLGLGDSVELPGATDAPGARLLESDLFLLPSREEGMSIALLEAMALGVPLVASAIPGNQHLVRDRVLGRLAPPNDPEALGRAILEQWAEFDQATRMGQAARRRVAEEFSIAAVARKHIDLFHRLLDERGRGAAHS